MLYSRFLTDDLSVWLELEDRIVAGMQDDRDERRYLPEETDDEDGPQRGGNLLPEVTENVDIND